MILWVILTLVAVLIGALYIYCAQQYARLPHIKGPRVKFPFGNALEFDVGNPILTFHEWHLKFGSVYKLFIFAMPVVQVNDPKLVRQIAADNETFPRGSWPWENDNQALGGEVLFAIDGPVWDTRRKRMNPHFSTSAFRAFAPSVSMITRRALVQLDQYAKSGQAFDLDYFTIGITFDVISQFVMNSDWNCVASTSEESRIIRNGFRAAASEIERLGMFPLRRYFPYWMRKQWRTPVARMLALLDTLYEARKMKAGPDDALQAMVNAGMTAKEVRDELIGILFAGHDTTAHTMTWLIYELEKNPDIKTAVLHEVAEALKTDRSGDLSALPIFESLESSKAIRLLPAAINEVLRLYPPGNAHPATAARDVMLGEWHIPAGTIVQINEYSMFRSPDLWEEPDAFRPHRFLAANPLRRGDVTLNDAFIPFFAGPHVCLGKQLALTELYTILPSLLHYFNFSLEPTSLTVPQSSITARPQHPLLVRVMRRV